MNELTIHDYLQKKGLSEYGIAGLMGNLFAESGLNPRNLQNSYENVLGMNDNAYVAAVDNGTYTNFVQDKGCPGATPACWRCCGRQPLYWRLPMPCC